MLLHESHLYSLQNLMRTVSKQNKHTFDSYTDFTSKYKKDFRAGGHSFLAWKMRKSLLNHMVRFLDGPKLDILDIGCNNGLMGREFCTMLQRQDIETVIDGIDFIESAAAIAHELNKYRSAFVADITDHKQVHDNLGERRYHLILCCEVFLYISPNDYDKFFNTILYYLSPGGYLLFVIPNVKSFLHQINRTVMPQKFENNYKYDYNLSTVRSLIEKFGFSINASYGCELFTNLKFNLGEPTVMKNLLSFENALLAKK